MPRPVEPGAVLRKPGTWVLIVALVYAGAQLLLLDPNRFYEWDEVIYVGEVSTDVPSISFSAHRARGITMVVAPVTLLTDSILVLRLYLIAASTTALATAFLIWRRVIAWGAPVAAAFFSIGWMTVFYGSEVSPNLYVAFAAVALLGMSIRYARSRSRWDLFWVGALVALAMLLRPSDAVVLAIGVTVVVAFIGRKALGAFAAALVGGVVLGALPWIVEASVRWDGPFDRLQTASEIVGGGTTFNLLDLMRLLDGPLVGPQTTDQLPVVGLLWVAGLASLGVVGLFLGQRDDRESGAAALMTSFLVALPYVAATGALAPRFLLPAIGLLCGAAGIGGVALVAAAPTRSLGAVPFLLLLVVGVAWNLPIVRDIGDLQTDLREEARMLGDFVEERANGAPCSFGSQYGYPQIAAGSGCRGNRWVPADTTSVVRFNELAAAGRFVVLLMKGAEPPALEGEWNCEVVEPLPSGPWTVCINSG